MTGISRPIPGRFRLLRQAIRGFRRARAQISLGGRGKISHDVVLGARSRWLSRGDVRIGPRVYIGADFFVETSLIVGPDVLISSRVAIIGDDHPFDQPSLAITEHARRASPLVVLEGDNLIGHGTIVLGPCRIGQGTIVGAGSLVIGDLPSNTICVGRPAKSVGLRRPLS